MVTLFYLIGIYFFMKELVNLRYPKKYLEMIRKVEAKNENGEGYDDGKQAVSDFSSLSKDDKKMIGFVLFGLSYISWTIIGCLFSSQWLLFVGLMAFGLAVGFYRRRFYQNNTMKSIQVIKFDAFVSAVWLAVLILNHFHKFV